MEVESPFSLDLINQYGNYFLDVAYSSYFLPETQINLKAVEYDTGIIFELLFSISKYRPNSAYATDQPVFYLQVTSIDEAFKELAIKVRDFLSKEQTNKLNSAVEQNTSYFTGTVVFYNVENNKIYLIKEKKKELWSKEASEHDIDRLINEMKGLAFGERNTPPWKAKFQGIFMAVAFLVLIILFVISLNIHPDQ